MSYGTNELKFATPFVETLVTNKAFRTWVLGKTPFARFSDEARLLDREMLERRSPRAKTWWRSHFQEACRCEGCSGQETDLLAIFEADSGLRFAIHIEIKHPDDRFKDERQARSYPVRADCWIRKAPTYVLPHTAATTALLFSEDRTKDYAPHLKYYAAHYTFEEIRKEFPTAVPSTWTP